MRCDCCGDEWDKEFFCQECSEEPHLVEVRRPKLVWDGRGDDMEMAEENQFRNVCGNCCPGHTSKGVER